MVFAPFFHKINHINVRMTHLAFCLLLLIFRASAYEKEYYFESVPGDQLTKYKASYNDTPGYNEKEFTTGETSSTFNTLKPDFKTTTSAQKTLITLDKHTYVKGDLITVTVKIRDKNGNPLSNLSAIESVHIPAAKLKNGTWWKKNTDNSFTSVWIATKESKSTRAILRLKGHFINIFSSPFSVVPASTNLKKTEKETTKKISTIKTSTLKELTLNKVKIKGFLVNDFLFDKDADFPTTGFKGATFTIVLDGADVDDFLWNSDTSWVNVKGGVVTFTDAGNGENVNITGTPVTGKGEDVRWGFKLTNWYMATDKMYSWHDAYRACTRYNYSLPKLNQFVGDHKLAKGLRGTYGGLWNEWGKAGAYKKSNLNSNVYWASDFASKGNHYGVGLHSGSIYLNKDNQNNAVICIKSL